MENLTDYQRLKETLLSFGSPLLTMNDIEKNHLILGVLCTTVEEMALKAALDEDFALNVNPMLEDKKMKDIKGADKEVFGVIMSLTQIETENSCTVYFFDNDGKYINSIGMVE